jgi:hypothetical protein
MGVSFSSISIFVAYISVANASNISGPKQSISKLALHMLTRSGYHSVENAKDHPFLVSKTGSLSTMVPRT